MQRHQATFQHSLSLNTGHQHVEIRLSPVDQAPDHPCAEQRSSATSSSKFLAFLHFHHASKCEGTSGYNSQGILNGYPGNTAIFREYLQNSDDARATKQACSSVPMLQMLTLSVRRPLRFSCSTSSNIRLKVYAILACVIVRDHSRLRA